MKKENRILGCDYKHEEIPFKTISLNFIKYAYLHYLQKSILHF
jgi:hypothetical protein